MDDKTKASLTNLETWKRGLFMVVFAIISGVAKLLVTLVAIFQFITVLFKGQTNEAMGPFGQNLSTYIYQITLFLTFNTDDMPFPFKDFPDGAPESNLHEAESVYTEYAEATTIHDEEVIDVADGDNKDDIITKKTSCDAPLNT
ncbi:DUF4389 domain-containing protein [uncultured Paraglaciecola sp.]|uniref:DUF4389 domain-containing protein n=1 Tax=uncultured Paraglaciecola sp. TaxID=1765024 RepID=UPI0030DB9BE9|tara:strand:+ start:41575 stop:42006 length:432 start_codon:yes stop_codon:yes gene_type:complete